MKKITSVENLNSAKFIANTVVESFRKELDILIEKYIGLSECPLPGMADLTESTKNVAIEEIKKVVADKAKNI